jgi:glycosyltransferase involved in cell wall biosynthesis
MLIWTIVIPIYNDGTALQTLLNEIEKLSFTNGLFLIVDNGSNDGKIRIKDYEKYTNVSYLKVEKNLGFGGGIKHGLKHTETKWVGWMPGNLKVHPSELLKIIPLLENSKYDFIKSKRIGRDIASNLKTFFAGLVQTVILRKNMLDTGGTPTFIKRKYLEYLYLSPNDYLFESHVMYIAHKLKLSTFRPKINYGVRIYGTSHWQRGINSELRLMMHFYRNTKKWRSDAQ